ncbi:hypothetical protein CBG50_02150 [Fusobacterium polymorphum]|jgi:hypothetical protein|uniref:Uncharacterized protein n=1 Tax=Fusobacterium nucleatum subsp. polymorphum TaxID=76857 RepID=A0A1Z3CFJ2_FUSNP|nr:hypothetical protein [Fusobacterium polymorphum]ASC02215.1 hypothetical protein CBG50_02150 [Fusobacterium polymorphum]
MKYFRLGYDQVFLPKNNFIYNNEKIGSLSIMIKYKLFNKKQGNEILFLAEKSNEVNEAIAEKKYIFSYVKCSFDKEKLIDIKIKNKELEKIGYRLEYEIDSYMKDILDDTGLLATPVEISKEEFCEIMKENLRLFDNLDNYPTQSTAFGTYEV